MSGILYVVATPIGNLEDFTVRAKKTLQQVDLIAAEDTRHSQKLLDAYLISKPMISLHNYNEEQRIESLIEKLESGKNIALISDAGTPLISDPGYRLVKKVSECGIAVVPIPGPSALICALSVAGLATDRFVYEGFLPAKEAARKARLEVLMEETRTLIFYESPHRIHQCLETLQEVMSATRQIVIAKELTKRFETVYRASIKEAIAWLKADDDRSRGEFVLILAGAEEKESDDDKQEAKRVLTVLLKQVRLKQAVKIATELCELGKNEIYALALELDKG